MEVPEPTGDLLQAAREEAWKRIQSDLEGTSPESRVVLAYIADRLRDPELETLFPLRFDAHALRHALDASDETFGRFRSELGIDPQAYLTRCKIQAAKSLLRYQDLKVWRIASFVGYSGLQPFWRAFKSFTGASPTQFRKRSKPRTRKMVPATELNSDAFWWQATVGALEPEYHAALLARLRSRLRAISEVASPTVTLAIRGTEHEDAVAQRLWETLKRLPIQEQQRRTRSVYVDSPAFFYLLGEKIRRQVRKDPQSCLELAELALEHLETNKKNLIERVSNLRALALAWLGNAQRLVWDYARAHQTFTRARQEWKAAGEDPRVEAELCDLEASLRMYQRRIDEALVLLARSSSLAQTLGHARILVSSLLQRVAILGPRGDHRSVIADLRLALRELEELDEPELTLVALCNLATAYVDGEKPRQALEVLPTAYELCEALDETVTRHQLGWTEGLARQALGDLDAAEQLLQEARVGFLDAGGQGYAAVVALDLGILCFEREQHHEVPQLAATAIPVFESLGLSRETVAAVELLRHSIIENAVTLPILQNARVRLVQGLRDLTTLTAAR